MSEPAFNDPRMMNNGFQDPMGNDAHQGLERFLDKFHQPAIPAYTIITDPEYYVFLWFHDAIGNLIECPYLQNYVPKLSQTPDEEPGASKSSVDFFRANGNFRDRTGIQSGVKNPNLPEKCLDLTPFVREATLPEIAPAGADKIKTLFGETSAGSFSPYASDGSKQITLQMLDTEYSIMDAIFYPWMKDINSPWWYRPEAAYTEWATPFPMATLEVQRPRMRYVQDQGNACESRNDVTWYTYYSYKFVGVKPTSYSSFDVNGAGRQNLLRSLTLTCDMCLVDLTGDVAGTAGGSMNLGNRTSFLFRDTSQSGSSNEDDSQDDPTQDFEEMERRALEAEEDAAEAEREMQENEEDIEQQEEGDMPGEDESEWMDEDMEDYDGEEYADEFGEDGEQDCEMDYDGEPPDPGDVEDNEDLEDEREPWEDVEEDFYQDGDMYDPNGDVNDYEMDNDQTGDTSEEESSFFGDVMDGLMDVGSGIMDAAETAGGWLADGADAALGLASDVAGQAMGAAVDVAGSALDVAGDVAGSALDIAGDVAGSALDVAGGVAQTAFGAAGDLASTVLGAASQVAGSTVGAVTDLAGDAVSGAGSLAGSALGAFGNAASGLLGGLLGGSSSQQSGSSGGGLFGALGSALNSAASLGQTAFGVVSSAAGSAASGLGTAASSLLSGAGQAASSALSGAGSIGSSIVKGAVGAASSTTSLLGGVLNKASSAAFSAVGNIVGQAGNVIGGTTKAVASSAKAVTGSASSILQSAGSIIQSATATSQVRKAGVMTSALNDAAKGISSGIGLVGKVATSVTRISTGAAGSVVSGLGGLVNRMVQSPGNKPTPVESYVAMVTKNNTKNMTMA